MKRVFGNGLCGLLILLLTVSLAAAGQKQAIQEKPAGEEVEGTLTGQFLVEDGQPLRQGVVTLFNIKSGPPPDQGLRRIPDKVALVDAEGEFTIEAPAGRYYLGAMTGASDRGPGPPRSDEKVYGARNSKGEFKVFILKAGVSTQGGIIAGTLHIETTDTNKAIAEKAKKVYATIEGTIRDAQGNPVVGMHVVTRSSLGSMRPDFISEPTGEDGGFRLMVPAGKALYIMARPLLSVGPPEATTNVGFYGGNDEPKAIKGKPGEKIKNINIVMTKMSDIKPNRPSFVEPPGSGMPFEKPSTTSIIK